MSARPVSRSAVARAHVAPRPLVDADLSRVRAVLTDVDGTLTTGGQLRASTVKSLEALSAAGVSLALVTGRPAGWGECWVRTLPVRAVVTENGGVTFVRDARGRIHKWFVEPDATVRAAQRSALVSHVEAALAHVPGARLSSDSAYTEVDLAIDYAEDADLGPEAAIALEAFLRARGVTAVRSSVHVNCWMGGFDKRTAARALLARHLRIPRAEQPHAVVYVGDSFNDAPLFAAFALSVGVANVRSVLDILDAPPSFITRAAEGRGFEELARALLGARRRVRTRR
ncbi:MAG: HAD-IIB family hydrolase [Myxococcaceae bacterium]|nr:HAD-IIB family hydrolase [Myxococcaceae bacterium]MCI0672892.1 HAD-IIB family hydrolase [Myxococcaceae bacterium]